MNLEDLDRVTLVAGAPSSGKTEFALGMLVAAMRRYGDGNAVMTVSGRQIAVAETVERCGTGCDHPQGTGFACGA